MVNSLIDGIFFALVIFTDADPSYFLFTTV